MLEILKLNKIFEDINIFEFYITKLSKFNLWYRYLKLNYLCLAYYDSKDERFYEKNMSQFDEMAEKTYWKINYCNICDIIDKTFLGNIILLLLNIIIIIISPFIDILLTIICLLVIFIRIIISIIYLPFELIGIIIYKIYNYLKCNKNNNDVNNSNIIEL